MKSPSKTSLLQVSVGLKFLIDKPTRTNIIFNHAWRQDSAGFYLDARETF